jgi:putative FmdB family regulatory protein
MPIYEYRCRDCRQVFDRAESLVEHGHKHPACPHCNGRHVEQVFTTFFAKTARKS